MEEVNAHKNSCFSALRAKSSKSIPHIVDRAKKDSCL